MSNNIFIDLTEELYNKGWTVNWEFNSDIDPALLKYNHCTTYTQCREVDANVYKDVDENGAWNYRLDNLKTGGVLDEEAQTGEGLFMMIGEDGMVASNTSLKSFNVDLPKLTNGCGMFSGTALTSFSSDLPNLTNGCAMFGGTTLTSFSSDLPNLTDGNSMFVACQNLTSFSSDLPKLTNGKNMFTYTALTSFSSDMPKLTNGEGMFGLTRLQSFIGDLSSLTNGQAMFAFCSSLASFEGDLSSLVNGDGMFTYCNLNSKSVQNIANTINDLSDDNDDGSDGWGVIDIDIAKSTPNAEEETSFNTIANKGWTVYVNGSETSWSSTASTNLTDEDQSTSIPFYAKPIQVTEEHADYTSSDGKFYSIVGAQFIYGDDLSTYGAFTSFEHAESEIMLSLNLTKIEKSNLSNLIKLK